MNEDNIKDKDKLDSIAKSELYQITGKDDFVKGQLEKDKQVINEILVFFSDNMFVFNIEQIKAKLSHYDSDGSRIMYSEVSKFVYALSSEKYDTLLTNLQITIEKLPDDCSERSYKILSKLWDHVNLASSQYSRFYNLEQAKDAINQQLDELAKPIIENMKGITKDVIKVVDKINKAQEDASKKVEALQNQVIAILGIFTAMSFAIFGGFTAVTGVFQNITTATLPTVIILGSLLGIVIIGVVYGFIYLLLIILYRNWDNDLNKRISSGKTLRYVVKILFSIMIISFLFKYNFFGIKDWLISTGR